MSHTKQEVLNLLSKIKIVKILSFIKNKNSDHLQVVQIDTGAGEKQIVTGASNFKEGDKVPYLGIGEVVPGFLFTKGERVVLEARKLRGYMSEGMLLAEDEIGLSGDHEGIMILEDDDSLIGKSYLDILSGEQLKLVLQNARVVEITPELQSKIDLILSIAQDGGEIVGEDQLPDILTSGEDLFSYDGFEPSGQMHIAQGIIRAINTNKMIKAGFTFKMWVADWFGYLNNKMGGDLEKIKKVGEYFIEIWRASGMDLDHTQFLWTSDFVKEPWYWENVMKVARSSTLKRVLRTTEIMGRKESDDLSAAQILYPCMQVADIFGVMKCQVTQLGLDQRKVNMLAREIGPEMGFWKPVVVSHRMLRGLGKPIDDTADAAERAIALKMSKSIPDSAIFMTDTKEDIKRKIEKAYCPEGVVEDNPVLEYCKYIIFEAHHLKGQENLLKDGFKVFRDEKFGGDVTYHNYLELESDFKSKALFPLDLKTAVVEYLDLLLQPVRKHFEDDESAHKLLQEITGFQVTR
jgi:tyrosyl-tRNA synthetase